MSMLEWAKKELDYAGYTEVDEAGQEGPNQWVRENVIELLEVFSKQGHSGSSAPYVIELFKRLASWNPISPLTGEDDEWNDVGEEKMDTVYQNRRDSAVFKRNGQAYDIEGIVFWEWYSAPDINDGKPYKTYFTGYDSRVNIEFPWTRPEKPEYQFKPNEQYPNEVLEQ